MKDAVSTIAAATGIAGAILYALQRFAYERFYDVFGLAPEDIGIDASRVLSQTALGLATWLLIVIIPVGLAIAVVAVRAGGNGTGRADALRSAGLTLAIIVVSLLFVVVLLNSTNASDAAKCAARRDGTGQSVRALRIRLPLTHVTLTTVGVRADRAVIKWTDPQKALRVESPTVVYLGSSEGTSVVYDPKARRVLRIPTAAAVVSIDSATPRYRIRKGCQPIRG